MTEPSEIENALAVIDATLAGEPVEPEDAELAELSLILSAMGEAPSPAFAAELDRRAQRRFAPEAPGDAPAPRPPRWRWLFAPGAAVGLAAVIAGIIVLAGGQERSTPLDQGLSRSVSIHGAVGRSPRAANAASSTSSVSASSAANVAQAGAAGTAGSLPTPPTSGRQIMQSAQLSLSTRPSRVDAVAQQVFDVVAAQNGVVESSNVSSSTGYGNAQFSLSVPSTNLSRALNALSELHGANVVSRSDSSQDITGQVGGAGRRLAEARALRTSLLRQLAAATTAVAVGSLKTQIRDADASIDSDLASLRSLQHKVAYSQISVSVNSVAVPLHPVAHGGGFTLSRAAHDAGRVLVVVAGVALIALAVLLPLGLLVAAGAWVAVALRRRRREHALDLI